MYDEKAGPLSGPLVTSYQELHCALATVLPQFVESIAQSPRSLTDTEVADCTTKVYFLLFNNYLREAHRLATA
jgi:hypothetical protein